MNKVRFSLLAGVVLLTLGAPAAHAVTGAPATVKVHVEGGSATLLPTTVVTTSTTPVGNDGNAADTCTGTSALGALDAATHGQWSGPFTSGLGYFVSTILGETPDSTFAFWNFYVNGISENVGACGVELQTGDDVLFFNSCYAPGSPCYTGEPLELTAPSTAVPGTPFTVHVTQSTTTSSGPPDFTNTTTLSPAAGATVSGAAAPATTNAAGDATVTLAGAGPATLRVTDASTGSVPDEATVCATNGADGACGTTIPAPPAPNSPAPISAQSGPDTTPPFATIAAITDRETFTAGHGPRTLSGTAQDPESGIDHVSLRLVRTLKGRCASFAASKATFERISCPASHGYWFKVGTTASWSYLLPRALGPGTYTLDVHVTNHLHHYNTALDSGKEHVVFTVR